MNLTPEFIEAGKRVRHLNETLGMNHPDTRRAMILMISLAPQEFKDKIENMARQDGLMPDPAGYLDDGTPVFSLDDIARCFGVSKEESEKAYEQMIEEKELIGLPIAKFVPNQIHIRQ